MSEKHTAEPWAIHSHPHYRRYDSKGNGIGNPLPWAIVSESDLNKHAAGFNIDPIQDIAEFARVICYLFPPRHTDEEVRENARRIVACVNACAGISNADLQRGAVEKLVEAGLAVENTFRHFHHESVTTDTYSPLLEAMIQLLAALKPFSEMKGGA